MDTRLEHIISRKVQFLTQSPGLQAPTRPASQPSPVPMPSCPLRAFERRRTTWWTPSPEPCILYLVSASDLSRKRLQKACTLSWWKKQSKFHSGRSSPERTEEQGCPQPRGLTCLLVRWLQAAASVVPLEALRRASLSQSPSSCSWQLKPFWEGQLQSWVESIEEGKWEESQSDFKESCRKPCNRRVTETVLTFILWKHLPLISA